MFRSFFIAGFEGATGRNRHGEWFDQVCATAHDREADEDYRMIAAAGFRSARECVRWPLVDRGGGSYDFTSVQRMADAARRAGVEVIWDLFHFGYPDGLDPLSPDFTYRFQHYCEAVARYLAPRTDGTFWVTPVNEPSYFAFAAGERRLFAPYLSGAGHDLKIALVRAAIAGIDAMRSIEPRVRILNPDPLCHVVAPRGRPDLEAEALRFNETHVYSAWDMLAGRVYPELGGSERHLDVAGINYYWTNQWELGCGAGDDGVALPLAEDDPRRVPFAGLVLEVMQRYGPQVAISETSHYGIGRAAWMSALGEALGTLEQCGRRPAGVCLYPICGMTDWHDPERWIPMGLWEQPVSTRGRTRRPVHAPMLRELNVLMGGSAA